MNSFEIDRKKAEKSLNRKIKKIIKRTGIKSFGCKKEDLVIFTDYELMQLNNHGLISDEFYHGEQMRRFFHEENVK